ncbi:MAG: ATP F0F1 synthase subunit B [Cyanobacteria bacterium J06648_16]
MLIDPFTVLAQIVNFLILVALLNRFLYKPITRAMTQREQTIAARLLQGEEQAAAARQEADRLQQMQQDFAAHREQRLAELRSQLEEERLTLLERAEDEVETARSRWYRALEQEKASVLRTFHQQAAYQLAQTVRRVLQDLADTSLEQQIGQVFLARLAELSPSEQALLQAAIGQANGNPVRIRSHFPLDSATQHAISRAVRTAAGDRIHPQFETDPSVGCGIALKAPGYRLDWNLATYLAELEQTLGQILDQQTAAQI